MKGYERSTYGEKVAPVYDEMVAEFGIDDPATVSTLAEYAGAGRVLELGVGTGRVAIPLAGRAVEVWGIDVSEAMLARLKEKPGGDRVTTALGDFADVAVDGAFTLVYCVFNTFYSLTTQAEQVGCFRNVAARLEPGGFFVLECFVPDLSRFEHAQHLSVKSLTADRVVLDVSVHDAPNQRVYGQQIHVADGGVRMYPVDIRYAWPSELDLMAGLAGMRLRERWGGWRREPFTVSSTSHVSLYEKPR